MPKTATNTAKGRRYTAAEKTEIINYVHEVNASKGRGGQAAASKKFKISPLTISSWMKSGGRSSTPRGHGTLDITGRKLAKLQALQGEIEIHEKNLAKLRTEFDALKRTL